MINYSIARILTEDMDYSNRHGTAAYRFSSPECDFIVDIVVDDEHPEDPNVEEFGPCPFCLTHKGGDGHWYGQMSESVSEMWEHLEKMTGVEFSSDVRERSMFPEGGVQ